MVNQFTYVVLVIAAVCVCLVAVDRWRLRRRLQQFVPLDDARAVEEMVLTVAPAWAVELGPDGLRAEIEICEAYLASGALHVGWLGVAASVSPTLLCVMAASPNPAVRFEIASRRAFLWYPSICRSFLVDPDPVVRSASIKLGIGLFDVLGSARRIFTSLSFGDAFATFVMALGCAILTRSSFDWDLRKEVKAGEPVAAHMGLRIRRP